jgi:hypothetical protein
VCEARAADRQEGTIADYGPYRDFYSMFEYLDHHTIANDEASPSVVAKRIQEGLTADAFRVS